MPMCYEFSLPWLVGTMEVLGVIRLTAFWCFFPGLVRLVLNQRLRGRGVSSLCRNPGHSLHSSLLSHTVSLTCSCQALLNLDLCLPISGKLPCCLCPCLSAVVWKQPPGEVSWRDPTAPALVSIFLAVSHVLPIV